MATLFLNKYRISSARAIWHNYDGGIYFVTFCTTGREHFLGEIVNDPGRPLCPQMQLTKIGQFVVDSLTDITTHYPYAEIPSFVVMPNHVHAIVFIHPQQAEGTRVCGEINADSDGDIKQQKGISPRKGELSTVIRGIKSAASRYAGQHGIRFGWQSRYYERIVRNQDELNSIVQYIDGNIANWKTDELIQSE